MTSDVAQILIPGHRHTFRSWAFNLASGHQRDLTWQNVLLPPGQSGPVCSSPPCWGLGPAGRGGLSVRDSRGHWLLPGFSQEEALLGNDRMEGERSLGTFPCRQQSRQWLPLLRAARCPWAGLLWFQLSLDPRPWPPGLSLCLLPGGGGTFPSCLIVQLLHPP